MRRLLAILAIPFFLAACAEPVWAPEEDVQRALHATGDAPSITLYTVIRVATGEGAHAALMVDSGHRVLFDPAGTWTSRNAPERNDVHFGITDAVRDFYIDYHVRQTYYVVEQKLYVTPEVAAAAMRAVLDQGAVPKAMCANSISDVLAKVPGLQDLPRSFFPVRIMRDFAKKPGVSERIYRDTDPDENKALLAAQAAAAL